MANSLIAVLRKLHAPMGLHVHGVDKRVDGLIEGRKVVLHIGSGARGKREWINMDIERHSDLVNLLGDGHALPFADGSVDAVIMKFVLEHVRQPALVLAEAKRVLKPGGLFFATAPFVEPYHAAPYDFQRYSPEGLRELFREFDVLECGSYYGPASGLVEYLREFVAVFFDTIWLKKAVRFIAGWLFYPLKFLDLYLGRKKYAWMCSYGLYILVRKH